MIAYVGADISAVDMLERWEEDVAPVLDREAVLTVLESYIAEVQRHKLGNVVEIEYPPQGGVRLIKLSDTPPGGFRPKLPK